MLLIEFKGSSEMRINCDNIESFGENADEKNLVLIYFQNQTDMLGR